MVGLNGADFLLLPIMGDHRADRWTPGNPIFHESRWKAIMRTRAMDNQLCLVVEPVDLEAIKESGRFQVVDGPATRFGARGDGTSLYVKDPDGNTVELRYYGT